MKKIILIFIILVNTIFADDFTEVFSKYKTTMTNLPQDENTKKLLQKYKPRVYIADGSYMPLDFYKEYLPHTYLKDKDRNIIIKNPTKEDLIKYHNKEGYYLDQQIDSRKFLNKKVEVHPKIYGRIYRDKIGDKYYLFLKYNMAFPYSGLPASTPKYKMILSEIVGDNKAWHELDIHGAYHLVIDEQTMKPVGVLLNQHNYHDSFILGEEATLPKDGRAKIAVAKYSNEPYLYHDKQEIIRTTGSPFKNIKYIHHKSDSGGLNSGYDYIGRKDEMTEINPDLVMLPPTDPLYTSHMLLGDKKLVFGFIPSWYFVGPPGMDFYTHPAMKNLGDLFSFWHIGPDDDKLLDTISHFDSSFMKIDFKGTIQIQEKNMIKNLQNLKEKN